MYSNEQIEDISSRIRYVGVFYARPPMPCGKGDVALCLSDDHLYMCIDGFHWEQIQPYGYGMSTEEEYPTHCASCGAILHSSRCEFCGTENRR